MDLGGTEACVMQMLRCVDRMKFKMDFLVHSDRRGYYDEEIRALGANLFQCPKRLLIYGRRLKQVLSKHGPYQVVHSHVHLFSGYVLRAAYRAGVPRRIVQAHATFPGKEGWARYVYLSLLRRWIKEYATLGLAVSRAAAANLFGVDWERDGRWQLFDCGIDFAPFHAQVDRVAVRRELGLPDDAYVVGHVGRFSEEKNHRFLVEIIAEAAKRQQQVRLLLVGDGPLRAAVEQQVAQAGLADLVIFAGSRTDVPRLMLGAMDVLVFPSLHEGLPLVLLESQAAGLPCICSDTLTEEVEVVKPLLRRLSLDQPASAWARAALSISQAAAALSPPEALSIMEQSRFRLPVERLEMIYSGLSS
jgi:glycosyltransferase involved in cell wall biosynthesis